MKKLILGMIAAVTVLMAGCSHLKETMISDYANYTEAKTRITVKDLCYNVKGDWERSNSEENAHIRLYINDGGLETIMERFHENGLDPLQETDPNMMDGLHEAEEGADYRAKIKEHELKKEMRKENIVAQYYITETAEGSYKPRKIYVYLTENPEGYEYMYLFVNG